MKKILLFLTLTSVFFICNTTKVYAKTNTFYEGEYIDGIYMVRYDKSTKIRKRITTVKEKQENI